MVDGSYVMVYSEVNLDVILGIVKDGGCCGCHAYSEVILVPENMAGCRNAISDFLK